MGMLSVVLLVVLVIAVFVVISIDGDEPDLFSKRLSYIKSLGLFALVLGMLGQFLGLFQAFQIIGSGMELSPAIIANGVKVSLVTTIYGAIIFLVSYLLWFALSSLKSKKA